MKYKYKFSNSNTSIFESIDIPVIFAMAILIAMAWFSVKIEHKFIKAASLVPEFTIVGQLDVIPVADTEIKKDAVKVGDFVSIAKQSDIAKTAQNKIADVRNITTVPKTATQKGIVAPRIIYKTMPDYPVKSVENSEQGTVIVSVMIQKNGKVGQTKIEQSSGFELLDKSALNAVSQWVFEPASSSNQLTECWFTIPIRFQLKS